MSIRLAVIGVGAMGYHHARVIADLDEAELVGVADMNGASAARVARRFGCVGYSDYVTLLDEQRPDAVVGRHEFDGVIDGSFRGNRENVGRLLPQHSAYGGGHLTHQFTSGLELSAYGCKSVNRSLSGIQAIYDR